MELVVGIIGGVVASVAAVFLIRVLPGPRISFSERIEEREDPRSPTGKRYYILVQNRGRRRVANVRIEAHLVRYLEGKKTKRSLQLEVSNRDGRVSMLEGRRAFRVFIYPDAARIDGWLFGGHTTAGGQTLRDLMERFDCELRVRAVASDGLTGVTRLAGQRQYTRFDVTSEPLGNDSSG